MADNKIRRNISKVVVSGNIGRVKDLKYFDNGGCVLSFSVANNQDYYKGASKEVVKRVIWYDCSIMGERAEAVHKGGFLKKAKSVLVTGHINRSPSIWEKDGKNQATIQIEVEDWEITAWNGDGEEGSSSGDDDDEEDIPF